MGCQSPAELQRCWDVVQQQRLEPEAEGILLLARSPLVRWRLQRMPSREQGQQSLGRGHCQSPAELQRCWDVVRRPLSWTCTCAGPARLLAPGQALTGSVPVAGLVCHSAHPATLAVLSLLELLCSQMFSSLFSLFPQACNEGTSRRMSLHAGNL